jgi:type I site-specific restriction-modification system R (restriction) subunit
MIPADVKEDAIKQIQRLNSPELIANNEAFHRMLTEGIKVSYHKDGADRGDLVWLIDFNNPQNNEFLVTNQFTIIENEVNKRPASSNKYTGCGPNELTCSLRRHRTQVREVASTRVWTLV